MGTRGVYGLRKDGKDKLTYNHYDSYPTGLGKAISEEIQEIGIKRLRQLFDRLEMVEDDAHPSEAHIQRALRLGLIDDDTSPKELAYYELLRKGQGELKTHIDTQLMIESNNFIEDSLYCEWGYIINLDTNMLEIYKGVQRKPHNKGRYASANGEKCSTGDTFYPCALIRELPLDALPPQSLVEKVMKELETVVVQSE